MVRVFAGINRSYAIRVVDENRLCKEVAEHARRKIGEINDPGLRSQSCIVSHVVGDAELNFVSNDQRKYLADMKEWRAAKLLRLDVETGAWRA